MYELTLNDHLFLPHRRCSISLSLHRGNLLVLCGENGIGKSTLLHHFSVALPETLSLAMIRQTSSDFFYDRRLGKVKEILFSSADESLDRSLFEELWTNFGLIGKEERRCSHLSGGERQVLRLCAGLSRRAEVLLLDEPTQFLDKMRKEQLKEILYRLLRQNKSILLVEHDLDWLGSGHEVNELEMQDDHVRVGRRWTT